MTQLTQILNAIDAANQQDPRLEEGSPKELLYGQRMSAMLARFAPDASEAVQIACRAQHIERWTSPRSDYPMTREGYFKWRIALYQYHANRTGELMRDVGYDEEMINRVKQIVGKKNIKTNPESQMLEDIAGMVFIEHYMYDFSQAKQDYSEDKWIDIIQKTWRKLSPQAHDFILKDGIKLPTALTPIILKAI